MLRQQAWFVPLRVHSPLSNACKAFVRACQSKVRDQAQIDQAFEALPAASYSDLEPHSAAWRELQGKLFAHEAVLWDLTALCCLPMRKQAGVQPPTFSRPSHLMPGAPADGWWICVDPDYCRPRLSTRASCRIALHSMPRALQRIVPDDDSWPAQIDMPLRSLST